MVFMRRYARIFVPLSATAVALLLAAAAQGQSLSQRVARADGTVRFTYRPKPGVCGDGGATIYLENANGSQRVQVNGNNWNYSSNRYADEWVRNCEPGPVRVALTVDEGRVSSLRTYVGGEWRPREGALDLGPVSAREAADFLLGVSERSTSRVGNDAIFAATLADSAEVWRRLLRMARSNEVARDVRKQAVFWLSQEAADAATSGLKEIIDSNDDLQVREQAVFALSQRPAEESVPVLIALVRRNDIDPRLKKNALFWLAQKDDPRAIALFEELLLKR
jgi:hypothetical protein